MEVKFVEKFDLKREPKTIEIKGQHLMPEDDAAMSCKAIFPYSFQLKFQAELLWSLQRTVTVFLHR